MSKQHIDYGGFHIQLALEADEAGSFGHADLYADARFLERISVGSAKSTVEDIERKLICLAKAKVDTRSVLGLT